MGQSKDTWAPSLNQDTQETKRQYSVNPFAFWGDGCDPWNPVHWKLLEQGQWVDRAPGEPPALGILPCAQLSTDYIFIMQATKIK